MFDMKCLNGTFMNLDARMKESLKNLTDKQANKNLEITNKPISKI